jgi:hypothetical protein
MELSETQTVTEIGDASTQLRSLSNKWRLLFYEPVKAFLPSQHATPGLRQDMFEGLARIFNTVCRTWQIGMHGGSHAVNCHDSPVTSLLHIRNNHLGTGKTVVMVFVVSRRQACNAEGLALLQANTMVLGIPSLWFLTGIFLATTV